MSKYTKVLLGTTAAFLAFVDISVASTPEEIAQLEAMAALLGKTKLEPQEARDHVVKAVFGDDVDAQFTKDDLAEFNQKAIDNIAIEDDPVHDRAAIDAFVGPRKAVIGDYQSALKLFAGQDFVNPRSPTEFVVDPTEKAEAMKVINGKLATVLFDNPAEFKTKADVQSSGLPQNKISKALAKEFGFEEMVRKANTLGRQIAKINQLEDIDEIVAWTTFDAGKANDLRAAFKAEITDNYAGFKALAHSADALTAEDVIEVLKKSFDHDRQNIAREFEAFVAHQNLTLLFGAHNANTATSDPDFTKEVERVLTEKAANDPAAFIDIFNNSNFDDKQGPANVYNVLKNIDPHLAEKFNKDVLGGKLREELDAAKTQLKANKNTIKKLTREKEALTAEKTQFEEKIAEVTAQIKAKDDEIEQLKKDAEAQTTAAQTRINELEAGKTALEEAKTKLEEAYNKSKEDYDTLEKAHNALESQNVDLNKTSAEAFTLQSIIKNLLGSDYAVFQAAAVKPLTGAFDNDGNPVAGKEAFANQALGILKKLFVKKSGISSGSTFSTTGSTSTSSGTTSSATASTDEKGKQKDDSAPETGTAPSASDSKEVPSLAPDLNSASSSKKDKEPDTTGGDTETSGADNSSTSSTSGSSSSAVDFDFDINKAAVGEKVNLNAIKNLVKDWQDVSPTNSSVLDASLRGKWEPFNGYAVVIEESGVRKLSVEVKKINNGKSTNPKARYDLQTTKNVVLDLK